MKRAKCMYIIINNNYCFNIKIYFNFNEHKGLGVF